MDILKESEFQNLIWELLIVYFCTHFCFSKMFPDEGSSESYKSSEDWRSSTRHRKMFLLGFDSLS